MYNTLGYAGFWRRFAAILIDGFVMLPVVIVIYVITMSKMMNLMEDIPVTSGDNRVYIEYAVRSLSRYTLFSNILYFLVQWLYFSVMESSGRQATLGKLAVGIKVTDLNGNRLSFARATGRYFAKIINAFTLYIGYLMAAFTEHKQGLHDMIAGTLVICKEYDTGAGRNSQYRPAQGQTDACRETARQLPENPPTPGDAATDAVCPKCRMINNSHAIFCSCCGDELKQNTERFGGGR